MQDLKPIRVFLEVAAQRSFAGAARSLRMTPASVTRLVAGLEADLGQQLLLRTTRQVSLTSAGALAAARYRPLIEAFDTTTDELLAATRSDRGRLSINAPISLGAPLLAGLVSSFRLAYPRIALDVQLTDALVDIVDENCDLAIRISGPPGDKSTIWRKICEVPRQLVAAPALFDRVPRPTTPDELDPAHCLSYGSGRQAETWRFRKAAVTRSFRAGTEVVTNNGEFLYGLAAAGNGIVNLPAFLTRDGIRRGEVVPLLSDWKMPPFYLMLYYPPYEMLPPLVATFTDFFEAYVRDREGFDFGEAAAGS
ncbi:LysR family transcriptional regulator [Acidimangrovimonas sediminis]|uniref:LysR family transcriptional regulator n=1 Tax=Acidimangrovimonas sediminis TaxID=2056283 RepID=UPI000C7FCB53|nr:LysR family transcriptional regulator [Acidimangrovimonas sediminis]